MDEITIVRKDRRDTVTDEIKRGPTHRLSEYDQMWCGVKIKGIASWNRHGQPEDVTCKACLTAISQDKPRSWKR
jgi:hypothetical protein